MRKIVVANWKMNGSRSLIEAYKSTCATFETAAVEVVVCPPFPLLADVRQSLNQQLRVGAQDCSAHTDGARTGDVSAALLAEVGAQYCIIGHSERRAGHTETSELISLKQRQLIAQDIQPILCVGETDVERREDRWKQVLNAQLDAAIQSGTGPSLVAYEPVWAIGTGLIPTSEIIVETISYIREQLGAKTGAQSSLRVLYGGSADETSAARLVSLDGVSGLLVGGASLDARRFGAMISSVAETNWDVLRD